MNRKLITLTAIILFTGMGLTLLHSCAENKDSVGTNVEDGIEVVDVSPSEGDGTVAEKPETTGEGDTKPENPVTTVDDVENVTNTPRSATLQEIEEMKRHLEQLLNDNYEIFNQIVSFFEENLGDYGCGVVDGEIVVFHRENPYGKYESIDLNDIEVGGLVAYIIEELGFIGISEEADKYVWFIIINGDMHPYWGAYMQGLVCNKSGVSDFYEIDDSEEGDAFGETIRIKDEWFRFIFYRPATPPFE